MDNVLHIHTHALTHTHIVIRRKIILDINILKERV